MPLFKPGYLLNVKKLVGKVLRQINILRTLKQIGANQEEVHEAIQKLEEIKREYQKLAYTKFPFVRGLIIEPKTNFREATKLLNCFVDVIYFCGFKSKMVATNERGFSVWQLNSISEEKMEIGFYYSQLESFRELLPDQEAKQICSSSANSDISTTAQDSKGLKRHFCSVAVQECSSVVENDSACSAKTLKWRFGDSIWYKICDTTSTIDFLRNENAAQADIDFETKALAKLKRIYKRDTGQEWSEDNLPFSLPTYLTVSLNWIRHLLGKYEVYRTCCGEMAVMMEDDIKSSQISDTSLPALRAIPLFKDSYLKQVCSYFKRVNNLILTVRKLKEISASKEKIEDTLSKLKDSKSELQEISGVKFPFVRCLIIEQKRSVNGITFCTKVSICLTDGIFLSNCISKLVSTNVEGLLLWQLKPIFEDGREDNWFYEELGSFRELLPADDDHGL